MSLQVAMLIYLDNDPNSKGSPNENFARELMELFTLGVNQYTQDDVVASARRLDRAQRRLRRRPRGSTASTPERHDNGMKTFMGTTQNWDGPQIITRILTVEPQTLDRGPVHRQEAVDVLRLPEPEHRDPRRRSPPRSSARTSTSATLLRAIFLHPEFYSTTAQQGLVRSPVEWVVTCLQAHSA